MLTSCGNKTRKVRVSRYKLQCLLCNVPIFIVLCCGFPRKSLDQRMQACRIVVATAIKSSVSPSKIFSHSEMLFSVIPLFFISIHIHRSIETCAWIGNGCTKQRMNILHFRLPRTYPFGLVNGSHTGIDTCFEYNIIVYPKFVKPVRVGVTKICQNLQ